MGNPASLSAQPFITGRRIASEYPLVVAERFAHHPQAGVEVSPRRCRLDRRNLGTQVDSVPAPWCTVINSHVLALLQVAAGERETVAELTSRRQGPWRLQGLPDQFRFLRHPGGSDALASIPWPRPQAGTAETGAAASLGALGGAGERHPAGVVGHPISRARPRSRWVPTRPFVVRPTRA